MPAAMSAETFEPKITTDPELLSMPVGAKAAGVSPPTLTLAIYAGEVPATRIAGRFFVRHADVVAWGKRRRKA